ncbi:MAG: hypothetical protein ACI4LK_08040 [Lentihominibacter sp.]
MCKNTIILTEAGKKIGMGHFVRMSAVCEGLKELGAPVTMMLVERNVVDSMVDKSYVKVFDWLNGNQLFDYIDENDIVIIDSYLVSIDRIDEINRHCGKLIVIDDNIRLNYRNVTIINPNIFGMFLKYPDNCNNTVYTGPGCTILREAFNNEQSRYINRKVSNVLITMGGTDIKNVTSKVIKYIKTFDNTTTLHVVVTDAYDEIGYIRDLLGEDDYLYNGISADEMSNLMRHADFAVASAGGTTNELIKMLCPSVLIGVADNQVLNIKYLSESNYIEVFSLSDMNPIRDMFSYERRERLYNAMMQSHSNETGVDIIVDVVKGLI